MNFQKGQRVIYVPSHAKNDSTHSDCQNGVVSSFNNKYIFVKYDNQMCTMMTGDEPYTAQATRPEDLRLS